MKISVAQTRPVKGDIRANIETHESMASLAISYKADAIFFPELSLTGYEPELAKVLAMTVDDTRLDNFQEISSMGKITIGLGMPMLSEAGIEIGMLIFQPTAPRQAYSKQLLHADELPYFVGGKKQVIITISNKKIAPAICYESLQIGHADSADQLGADIYVASVSKSQSGIEKAMVHYPLVSRKFSMPVLMANCVGFCDNFESAGKSAVWSKQGYLAGQLGRSNEGILVFDTETGEIIKHTL